MKVLIIGAELARRHFVFRRHGVTGRTGQHDRQERDGDGVANHGVSPLSDPRHPSTDLAVVGRQLRQVWQLSWTSPLEPLLPSLRAAIERCSVGLVAIDKIDRVVGLLAKGDIAHQRAGRKLALDVGVDAFAVRLGIKEFANADL